MPNFFELLLSPIKLVKTLLGVGAAPMNAPAGELQSRSVDGLDLCYSRAFEGRFVQVCQVSGYEMPSFIFWAAVGIILLFSVTTAILVLQCRRLSESLEKLVGLLSDYRKTGTEKHLTQANDFAETSPLLGDAWMRYSQTLLVSKKAGKNLIFNSQDPEKVLGRREVVDDNTMTPFFGILPGILTGLGLLMTFIAILDGLSHVTVTKDFDVQGIGGLINGLSGKFVTSIVAVFCSVAFVVIERISFAKPARLHRRLLSELAVLFPIITAEIMLFELHNKYVGVKELEKGTKRLSP